MIAKTSIDKGRAHLVFPPLFRMTPVTRPPLPGSSVAEQVTVNHLVAGSIPARAAMKPNNLRVVGLLLKNRAWPLLGHFLCSRWKIGGPLFAVRRLPCSRQRGVVESVTTFANLKPFAREQETRNVECRETQAEFLVKNRIRERCEAFECGEDRNRNGPWNMNLGSEPDGQLAGKHSRVNRRTCQVQRGLVGLQHRIGTLR